MFRTTLCAACLLAAPALSSTMVYTQDFETDMAGFSGGSLSSSPAPGSVSLTQYLYMGTGSTVLTVDLSAFAHSEVSLAFDLYLFRSWDGEDTTYGKDYFTLADDITFSETFTNHQSEGQSYLGAPTEVYGSGTSAAHIYRSLGPVSDGSFFSVLHTADTFTVTFAGVGLTDEYFGIDNVSVSVTEINAPTVPLPAGLPLIGSGLAAIALLGARRSGRRN